jgi:DNA-binding IclR family transcriptional regulator
MSGTRITDRQVRLYMNHRKLHPQTLVSKKVLIAVLKQVQHEGISMDVGAMVEGAVEIAALSFDCNGAVFGGIAAAAPNARMLRKRPGSNRHSPLPTRRSCESPVSASRCRSVRRQANEATAANDLGKLKSRKMCFNLAGVCSLY